MSESQPINVQDKSSSIATLPTDDDECPPFGDDDDEEEANCRRDGIFTCGGHEQRLAECTARPRSAALPLAWCAWRPPQHVALTSPAWACSSPLKTRHFASDALHPDPPLALAATTVPKGRARAMRDSITPQQLAEACAMTGSVALVRLVKSSPSPPNQ